jgi:hypothetical protein
MAINIPLEDMSSEEKIEAMETIWEDLCENADSLGSPPWHEEILKDREEEVSQGRDKFVDWDAAKKDIRNKLNEN